MITSCAMPSCFSILTGCRHALFAGLPPRFHGSAPGLSSAERSPQARVSAEEASPLFGVAPAALRAMSRRELTRLFRQKAREHHPDAGGKAEKFIQPAGRPTSLLFGANEPVRLPRRPCAKSPPAGRRRFCRPVACQPVPPGAYDASIGGDRQETFSPVAGGLLGQHPAVWPQLLWAAAGRACRRRRAAFAV